MSKIIDAYKKLMSAINKKNISDFIANIGDLLDDFMQKNKMFMVGVSFFLGAITSGFIYNGCSSSDRASYIKTIKSLNDTISVVRVDKNNILSQKTAIEMSLSDMKSLSAAKDSEIGRLMRTIKELKNTGANPVFVSDVNINSSSTIVKDTSIIIPYNKYTVVNFSDSILNADVSVSSDSSGIKIPKLEYSLDIPLSVSLSKDGIVSVKTNNKINVSRLESWVDPSLLNKNKKKWFTVGVQSGYGLTLHGHGPYFGVGIGVNIINF